jgi:acetaldehyde dehydrogenase (acetylating)
VIINSPTTHGAIGFSTDLDPSMTLGCGSWGGNVTSDNVSPRHLMDIKRVAFETKPMARPAPATKPIEAVATPTPRKSVKREEIAALVDSFLSKFAASASVETPVEEPVETPRQTVVHHVFPQAVSEEDKPVVPLDFVSEDDVRRAIGNGKKIPITKKTILTPSARDLGEEKEVFHLLS